MDDLIRVLIADDHEVVRRGLMTLLVARNGMEVVGEATNGREAVELARALQPDVILMDMYMPEMNGPEAITDIKENDPDAHILVLTSFGDLRNVSEAIKVGALGYLLKDSSPDDLFHAVRNVHRGSLVLPGELAQGLIEPQPSEDEPDPLTRREFDVLRLLALGKSNQEIGLDLHISLTTVRSHVSNILMKLQAANRTQAALIARERGLI